VVCRRDTHVPRVAGLVGPASLGLGRPCDGKLAEVGRGKQRPEAAGALGVSADGLLTSDTPHTRLPEVVRSPDNYPDPACVGRGIRRSVSTARVPQERRGGAFGRRRP
jgi:hypothetical protein